MLAVDYGLGEHLERGANRSGRQYLDGLDGLIGPALGFVVCLLCNCVLTKTLDHIGENTVFGEVAVNQGQ